MTIRMRHTFGPDRGFTLIEVLIALLVLSIGLLGLAAMQAQALKMNQSAYLRSQATLLAYDMLDRLKANRAAALDGDYNADFDDAPTTPTDCTATDCTTTQLAGWDSAQWRCLLGGWDDNSVCANTLNIRGVLPNGTGSVTQDDNRFTVTVRWDDRDSGTSEFSYTTELREL